MSNAVKCKKCGLSYYNANYCPKCGLKAGNESVTSAFGCLIIIIVVFLFFTLASPYLAFRAYQSQEKNDGKTFIWTLVTLLVGYFFFVNCLQGYYDKSTSTDILLIPVITNFFSIVAAIFIGFKYLYEPDNNSKRFIFLILSVGLFLGCAFYVYNVKSAGNVEETSKVSPTSIETIPSVSEPFETPKMVFVKGGTFEMGNNEEEDDDDPIHLVTVSDFQIGKFEVTQAEWKAIMGENPSNSKGDNLPVEQVSWDDVQEFLKKLNTKTGKKYRLPTEAEWEYAARGGNASKNYEFSGSNTLNDVAWNNSNSGSKTHPVGGLAGNELGIKDMSGNVSEWCSDWYRADYYENSPAQNPKDIASGTLRVLRGGSWNNDGQTCQSSYHEPGTPGARYHNLGFRLVFVP